MTTIHKLALLVLVALAPLLLTGDVLASPAARVGDMHTCPMVTGIIPHVGGPALPPGSANVLICGLPALREGDLLTCVGPPDSARGSSKVLINGRNAATIGNTTAHGGVIVSGCPNVLIGQ